MSSITQEVKNQAWELVLKFPSMEQKIFDLSNAYNDYANSQAKIHDDFKAAVEFDSTSLSEEDAADPIKVAKLFVEIMCDQQINNLTSWKGNFSDEVGNV